jgi:Cu/Ag efflux protein CusF
MTMVFRVGNPELLAKAQVGDKIQFRAENSGGAMVVTDIQRAK